MKSLGASDDIIVKAETEMSLRFPEGLKSVLRVSNGLDLPGGWRLLPVFDPGEPRKTCSHIGYENSKGRWSYMSDSLVTIATGDTGNQLVLLREGNDLGDQILFWDHETNKTRKWGKDFNYLLEKTRGRCSKIDKQIARSMKERRSDAQPATAPYSEPATRSPHG